MTAYARATDPAPSHEAAAGVSDHTTDLEARVLAALAELGEATSHQIAEHTGLDLVTISPRMKPLVTKRRIYICGAERSSGRPRTLYRLLADKKGAAA